MAREGDIAFVSFKRICSKCKLFKKIKSGKMSCWPIGEILNPDIPHCSFYNLEKLIKKEDKHEDNIPQQGRF